MSNDVEEADEEEVEASLLVNPSGTSGIVPVVAVSVHPYSFIVVVRAPKVYTNWNS